MFWVMAGAAACLTACSGDRALGDYPPSTCDLAEPPRQLSDTPLSIATFWVADSHERDAFQTLVDRVDSTRYFVSTQQMRTRVEAQRHISDSFENQRLPNVFQVNAGSDVLRWVNARNPESADVCALDRLRDTYGWSDRYFSAALAPLTCHAKLYGLPVGIHRLNVLFYNRDVFADLAKRARAQGTELVEPSRLTSAQDLLSELERVRQLGAVAPTGQPLLPLAIDTTGDWPLTHIAFENLLVSLGNHAYETLWMGGLEGADAARAAELETTLEEMVAVLRALHGFSAFPTRVSWQEALRQVGAGEALMTIGGDWGLAQLGPDALSSVETAAFPGTDGSFVYTPDSFAVPRELGKNGFPARSFLHDVIANKDALIEFSKAKHSIPPRQDLTPDEIEALAGENLRATYRQFARCSDPASGCQLLLAVSGLGPPPGAEPCFDELDELLSFAVSGSAPAADFLAGRLCDQPFPSTSAEAERRLIELLLSVATQRFAADCR